MAGFRESLGNAYRGALCGSLDLRDQIAGLTLRRAPAALALVNAINGFQGLYCDRQSNVTEDDIAPRPFEGGQCPGVSYSGQIREEAILSGNTTCEPTISTLTWGPVVGPIERVETPNQFGGSAVSFRDGNGVQFAFAQTSTGAGSCPYLGRKFFLQNIVRNDGLPDDCGGPPRELPPESTGWVLPPVNFSYENDLGITVNATANITLAPAINNDFSVSFPTTITVGDINLSGQLNLDGSLTFSPTLNVNPAPQAPSFGPEIPGDQPPAPDMNGDVLAGVIIRVTTTGRHATVLESIGSPDLVIPRAASVSFLQPVEGQEHWSSDYDAKNTLCFVPVPSGPESVDAAVTPYPGVVLSWRRVFKQERIRED